MDSVKRAVAARRARRRTSALGGTCARRVAGTGARRPRWRRRQASRGGRRRAGVRGGVFQAVQSGDGGGHREPRAGVRHRRWRSAARFWRDGGQRAGQWRAAVVEGADLGTAEADSGGFGRAKVELISGSASNVDVRGQTQLVNVVLKQAKQGGSPTTWVVGLARHPVFRARGLGRAADQDICAGRECGADARLPAAQPARADGKFRGGAQCCRRT